VREPDGVYRPTASLSGGETRLVDRASSPPLGCC